MAFRHFSISFIITFLLFLIPKTTTTATTTSPIPSPPPPSNSTTTTPPTNISTAAQDYTNAHNKARSEVNVPPLTWNISLATTATNLARYQRIKFRCDFADLNSSGGVRRYGANQALASGREVTPREAVEYWVKEKVYYNREMNKCVNGHETCGVYTQVVWNKSKELGCAQTVCGGKEGKSLTICLYYPPGNVIGETPY